MSNEEIKKTIIEYYKLLDQNEMEQAADYLSEDAICSISRRAPITGKDNIRVYFSKMMPRLDVNEHEINNFIIEGDNVAIEGKVRFTNSMNQPDEFPFAVFFKMKRGKICIYNIYFDSVARDR